VSVEGVIARRQAERTVLLDLARAFVQRLPASVGLRAAVVFGSVARGDFNRWSDVDVLVIAEHLPDALPARLDLLSDRPAGVQAIAWTPGEWSRQRTRRNPIALEALEAGVWLDGSPEDLSRSR
jgi:hypothetical protein